MTDEPTTTGDGRDIDLTLGALTGEAAGMRVERPELAFPARAEPDAASAPLGEDPTYYDLPVVKEPVWIWTIPTYFFVGGTAGAASVLAGCCELTAPRAYGPLVRRARRLALAGDLLGAGLLTYDLGRPARFLNMLRVFRPTSPMSVGSWLLAASGATNGAAVLLGERGGLLGRVGWAASLGAAALGGPLAGYTGVLLANTAIPVWSAAHRELPPLFIASSAASAGWALSLLPTGERGRRLTRSFALAGTLAELALARALHARTRRVPRVARPLERGPSGGLWRASTLLGAAAVGAALRPRGPSWTWAAGLGLAASLATRFALFHAGKASARDPRATFHQQRERRAAA